MNLSPPESDPGLSRRERKAAESRDKIFRAAIELFSREGLDGVTIEQITERADVGKGLFFHYFPNKEAVLNHFGTLQVLRLREALATGEISGPPRRRAEQVLSLLCTYPEITPELARNLFLSALATREFREIGGPNIWEVRDLLADIIREGQATGESGLFIVSELTHFCRRNLGAKDEESVESDSETSKLGARHEPLLAGCLVLFVGRFLLRTLRCDACSVSRSD